MAKVNGLDVEKIAVINKVGMKFEKAVLGMDREALDAFKAMMGINTSFSNGRATTERGSLVCPFGFKPAVE